MLQRTNIYLPVEMINFLKRKAESERVTMSEIIRGTVKKELEKERENWAESLLALSKRAPKTGHGIKDLSKRHDYYLYIEPYEREQIRLRKKKRK